MAESIGIASPPSENQTGNKLKITFTGPQETLIGPLVARATDARSAHPILNDTDSIRVMDQIDHDFDKFGIYKTQATIYALRALCLDRWTTEFLSSNPQATVVHLACGLDDRLRRVQADLTKVRWIDLDLPDVVELRNKLIPYPEGDYRLIAADATEKAWLEQIPVDRPAIIICQGLAMFLEEESGKRMIRQIIDHFKSGQLIIDHIGTILLSFQNQVDALVATGSSWKWAIDEPKTLEALHPQLKMVECLGPTEFGDHAFLPLGTRLMMSTYSDLPWLKYISCYMRFDF
ncbi:putative polyketide synthase protein [Daldinia vernicosa]|uniref:putative polyketide synthase protein n=1 Tax=Daldinia vernicosa TaxID=114800 RepID=UPI002007ED0D|nr:putative polyketide synthase protein [Daldinia vernicosa]KAI0844628.1 putative polyketide synthase protein [Daldinia vernicosa]